jgi:hypothetical protein
MLSMHEEILHNRLWRISGITRDPHACYFGIIFDNRKDVPAAATDFLGSVKKTMNQVSMKFVGYQQIILTSRYVFLQQGMFMRQRGEEESKTEELIAKINYPSPSCVFPSSPALFWSSLTTKPVTSAAKALIDQKASSITCQASPNPLPSPLFLSVTKPVASIALEAQVSGKKILDILLSSILPIFLF